MLNSHKSLAIAISESGISAAEVAVSGGKRTLTRCVALEFTGEIDLDHPEQLGKELKRVLHANGMSSSRCIVGLSASRIASREKSVPATDAESLRGVLSIAAERDFASAAQDLAFDYVVAPSGKGLLALVAAAPRRVIDQVQAMVQSAGLSVEAITSSSAAACGVIRSTMGLRAPCVALCVLPRVVELTVQSPGGALRLIRHLPVKLDQPSSAGVLAGEVRRALATVPADGEAAAERQVLVWDCVGVDSSTISDLGKALGMGVRVGKMPADLGLAGGPEGCGPFVQAAALACLEAGPGTIDFLHSRMVPPRKKKFGRVAQWAVVAALVVLGAVVWFILDWRATLREVADIKQELSKKTALSKEAKVVVDDVRFARSWFDRRPGFLDCMMEIVKAFPDDGRIWVSTMTIEEDMRITLTGKSVSQDAVLEVIDNLRRNKNFTDVKPGGTRSAGGTSRIEDFSVSLTLKGAH